MPSQPGDAPPGVRVVPTVNPPRLNRWGRLPCIAAALLLCAGASPAPSPNVALVVGISRYEAAAPLRCPPADAKRIAGVLTGSLGFPRDSVEQLTDSGRAPRVTGSRVREALDRALDRTGPESTFVFYFSGHGVRAQGKDWLIPSDGRERRVPETCLQVAELLERIRSRKPKHALVFLDACRDPVPPTLSDPEPLGDPRRPDYTAPGLSLFYSCRPGEISREGRKKEPLPGSVFTHYLAEGLSGAPAACQQGRVTLESLARYLAKRVPAYVRRNYLTPQTPSITTSPGNLPDRE